METRETELGLRLISIAAELSMALGAMEFNLDAFVSAYAKHSKDAYNGFMELIAEGDRDEAENRWADLLALAEPAMRAAYGPRSPDQRMSLYREAFIKAIPLIVELIDLRTARVEYEYCSSESQLGDNLRPPAGSGWSCIKVKETDTGLRGTWRRKLPDIKEVAKASGCCGKCSSTPDYRETFAEGAARHIAGLVSSKAAALCMHYKPEHTPSSKVNRIMGLLSWPPNKPYDQEASDEIVSAALDCYVNDNVLDAEYDELVAQLDREVFEYIKTLRPKPAGSSEPSFVSDPVD